MNLDNEPAVVLGPGLTVEPARASRWPVEVVAVTDLTAWYRRIEFAGHGLLARLQPQPAHHLWLHLTGPAGQVDRAYSLVDPDPAADRFSLDFVLHQPAGPASKWAAAARPGAVLRLSDPPQQLVIPTDIRRAVLIGDASAASAMASVRQALAADISGTTLLVDPHPGLDRLPPTGAVQRLSALTADAWAGIAVDPERDWLWAAGERQLVKAVRHQARQVWGLSRQRQHLQTYWIAS